MMKQPTMLYKFPGKHPMHGDFFDYCIVAADQVKVMLKEGWYRTTGEAKRAVEQPELPKTTKMLRRRKYTDLSDDEIADIAQSKETKQALKNKYCVSWYTIDKIRNSKS